MRIAADAEKMEELGGFRNWSAEMLAEKAFTSVRTARRWKRSGCAPRVVVRWLRLVTDGDLGTIDASFKGFAIYRGQLHVGNEFIRGYAWTAHEFYAMVFRVLNARARDDDARLISSQREIQQAGEHQQEQRRPIVGARLPDHINGFEATNSADRYIAVHIERSALARLLGLDDLAAARDAVAFP